jgi:hypothetical protein
MAASCAFTFDLKQFVQGLQDPFYTVQVEGTLRGHPFKRHLWCTAVVKIGQFKKEMVTPRIVRSPPVVNDWIGCHVGLRLAGSHPFCRTRLQAESISCLWL